MVRVREVCDNDPRAECGGWPDTWVEIGVGWVESDGGCGCRVAYGPYAMRVCAGCLGAHRESGDLEWVAATAALLGHEDGTGHQVVAVEEREDWELVVGVYRLRPLDEAPME
jgi:hypothetical protein